MDIEQVRDYTLSINGVTEDQPFGDDIITFRIEGKIFLCLWLGGGKHDIKGNTEPRVYSETYKNTSTAETRYFSNDGTYHQLYTYWRFVTPIYFMCKTE